MYFKKFFSFTTVILYLFLGIFYLLYFFICYSYFRSEIYDFDPPSPFVGKKIYNPYQLLDSTFSWHKANFHAHSKAWLGITNGFGTEEELLQKYKDKGYSLPSVSNYHKHLNQRLLDKFHSIKVYEHGYNIFKTHLLVINGEEVDYFDILSYQFLSHQQYMISRLHSNDKVLLSLNHPAMRGGRPKEYLKYLSHYHFLEVLNPQLPVATDYWDVVLSSGKLVWIIANDDSHKAVLDQRELGVSWNHIVARENTPLALLEAMKKGQSIGIKGMGAEVKNTLDYLKIDSVGVIHFALKKPIEKIRVIGQGGEVMMEESNSNKLTYLMPEKTGYIRFEALSSDFSMFFNPIVRYNGEEIKFNGDVISYKKNIYYTLFFQILWIILGIIPLFSTLFYQSFFKK